MDMKNGMDLSDQRNRWNEMRNGMEWNGMEGRKGISGMDLVWSAAGRRAGWPSRWLRRVSDRDDQAATPIMEALHCDSWRISTRAGHGVHEFERSGGVDAADGIR